MVLQLVNFSNLRNVLEFYFGFCIWHNYFVLLKKWIKLKLKTVSGSTLRLRRLRLRVCRASVSAETRQGGSRKSQTLRLQKMRLQVKICSSITFDWCYLFCWPDQDKTIILKFYKFNNFLTNQSIFISISILTDVRCATAWFVTTTTSTSVARSSSAGSALRGSGRGPRWRNTTRQHTRPPLSLTHARTGKYSKTIECLNFLNVEFCSWIANGQPDLI